MAGKPISSSPLRYRLLFADFNPTYYEFFELAIVEKERAIFKIGLDRVNHRESAPGNSQYKSYFFRCFKIEHKIKLIQNAFCLGQ